MPSLVIKLRITLCMVSFFFLFFLTLTYAVRPGQVFAEVNPNKTQHKVMEADNVEVDESCEGIGDEECLMRRTLAAHIDYIYTQKQKP
ncbi:Phytosulfokines 3 [Quillaja saponaria]|uniref:Phytosulfokine n=1 Tax=Quillaja saponaria TaxID=32244 RepID=A0AAD7P918_QUISA|nr:Phytosulfokines 3 [Quillaja saponaria]